MPKFMEVISITTLMPRLLNLDLAERIEPYKTGDGGNTLITYPKQTDIQQSQYIVKETYEEIKAFVLESEPSTVQIVNQLTKWDNDGAPPTRG